MQEATSPKNRLHRAALLLGPTGAGKTPLGQMIESRGLWGDECLHFDFGANLRRVVDENRPDEVISRADIEFLRGVLASGALLEDEHFPIARRILMLGGYFPGHHHPVAAVPQWVYVFSGCFHSRNWLICRTYRRGRSDQH